MNKANNTDIRVSKALSYLLRHGAEKEGIPMRNDGYVVVDDLLKHKSLLGVSLVDIERIVRVSDKQRFKLTRDDCGQWVIRANQGHSLARANVEMASVTDPAQFPVVIHGTTRSAYRLIAQEGLKRMGRQHIHFASGIPGASGVISGMRATSPVWIFLDLRKALADSIPFFVSDNGVILSPGNKDGIIPAQYFARVEFA